MNAEAFEYILNERCQAYAYLSPEQLILASNDAFSDWVSRRVNPVGRRITEVIPEVVGLEALLNDIISGKQRSFILPNLTRGAKEVQDLRYFDLSFFQLPDDKKPLFLMVSDVTESGRLRQQILQKENELNLLRSFLKNQNESSTIELLGNSQPIQKVRNTISKLKGIPSATVLVEGESGTGKSMLARIIHFSSQSAARPFVEINCAAIPESLLESELFGYEKGAFTGAATEKEGLIETAAGGTLFLDEIGEMPLEIQAKLLSFIESRRFRRLGSTREREVSLRIIAATNRNLTELVEKDQFRDDLFFRLNVVQVTLPPLRAMGSDILQIAQTFTKRFNLDFRKHVIGFTPEAEKHLLQYQWPGNVRELRNAIERAMIFMEGDRIGVEDLSLGILRRSPLQADPLSNFRLPEEGLSFSEIEKRLLEDALDISAGNQSKAAQLLSLSRDAFRYRLEKHNLI